MMKMTNSDDLQDRFVSSRSTFDVLQAKEGGHSTGQGTKKTMHMSDSHIVLPEA